VVEISLPISFFICYGGAKGLRVAEMIRDMPMDRELFNPFLATPDSLDMIPGTEQYNAEIDKRIIDSQLMVVVGTCDIKKSKPAMREIKLARNEGIHIIVYLEKGCRSKLPQILSGWHPIEYPEYNPRSRFDRLRLDILRTCLRIANTTTVRRESS